MKGHTVRTALACFTFSLALTAVPLQPKESKSPGDSVVFKTPPGAFHTSETPGAKSPISLFGGSEAGEPSDDALFADKHDNHRGSGGGHHGKPHWDDPSSVPEPATYGLLGAGMIGLALLRKRTHPRGDE